jgi:hypothetical protein
MAKPMQIEQPKLSKSMQDVKRNQNTVLACTVDLLEISKVFHVLTFDRKYLRNQTDEFDKTFLIYSAQEYYCLASLKKSCLSFAKYMGQDFFFCTCLSRSLSEI